MHNKSKHIVGITGGIGSGKSHVCHMIESMGYPVFYCDDEAKRIIRTHPDVRQELCQLINPNLYDANGILQKKMLASHLCRGKEYAAQVDRIVHPRVAKAFQNWCMQQNATFCFMECALLFESGFDRLVQHVVHIDTPENVRLRRIMQRDNISEESARKWIALQMPETEKKQRADYCICNDDGIDTAAEVGKALQHISAF